MSELTNSAEWQALVKHQQHMQGFDLSAAFTKDHHRARKFSLEAAGIFLDYSKHLLTSETKSLLFSLAKKQGLVDAINRLQQGGDVNLTEKRPALHHLLRQQSPNTLPENLLPKFKDVQQVKVRMQQTATDIQQHKQTGFSGKPFTDVVHIGIGGSDLGPAMVYQALKPYQLEDIRCHFVANICANDILETLADLNAETTLFIVASKSFTTLETIKNADTARAWLLQRIPDNNAIGKHFMAVTSKPERAEKYGILADNIFPFWDWVGGRYSVWSAISLSLCIGLGFDTFNQFLTGANTMDQHFFTAPIEQNLPALMAMLGVWYTNFWQKQSALIAPYDHRLRRLPAFLQQLEMESNGKSATLAGNKVDYATCPVIWGEVGANSQHSFFQRLHQGPEFVPVDFIVAVKNHHDLQEHQDWLFANCLAQSQALMVGKSIPTNDPMYPHTDMPGNRPSSTVLLKSLTPDTLGALLALYEHKVYVQSVIWQINAFDQWGVELGKVIGNQVKQAMEESGSDQSFDGSTQQLLQLYKTFS